MTHHHPSPEDMDIGYGQQGRGREYEDDANTGVMLMLMLMLMRGAIRIFFRKNLGFWPNQRPPPPLPVSWAAEKRKKSLMFILHFRLF